MQVRQGENQVMTGQVRQGDVLLVPCDEPIGATPLEPDGDRVVLAHGEATGHAHAVSAKHAVMCALAGVTYLRVLQREMLRHEEHEHVELEPGWYRLPGQREYAPQELRRVAD